IFTFLLFFASNIAYSQTNLLQNADFENWTGGNPDPWINGPTFTKIPFDSLWQETNIIYSGSNSVKLYWKGDPSNHSEFHQVVSGVSASTEYTFSLWFRGTDSPSGEKINIGIAWYDNSDVFLDSEWAPSGNGEYAVVTNVWQEKTMTVNSPENTAIARVVLRGNKSNPGYVYIDNAEFLGVSSTSPTISDVTHEVFPANTPITIQATITDNEGIDTAKVHYQLNLGSEEIPVIMTNISGDLWEGIIPAQTDGTGLEYWISAKDVDASPNTTTSSVLKTLIGCATLSKAHEVDGNGVMLYKDFMAKVKGIVTAATGTFHETQQDDYIQDGNYGINVFSFNIVKSMALNDSVEITGSFDQYNGKSEIIPDTIIILNSGNTPPEPVIVTCGQVNEDYEGVLIKVVDGIISGWVEQAGSSFTAALNDGTADLDLRVNESTDIDGHAAPPDFTPVIGIASQHDYSSPYTEGYQILPRCWGDMSVTGINDNPLNTAYVFALKQNYPNPFNPSTIINYELPITNYVELSVYNALGQKVRTLVNRRQDTGKYSVQFNADGLASGIYFINSQSGQFAETKTMILLR
ncbi:MAG: T9SS type A sorting domain-containing protein, partial [Calditrichales bacterium]|nr:T9SS type A sorting domain-containing protein [Calditrichales bacterium]